MLFDNKVNLHKHTPQIIHMQGPDGKEYVLLTSFFVAKITDLGNSRIVNLQPSQLARTLSRFPGTLVLTSSHLVMHVDLFNLTGLI